MAGVKPVKPASLKADYQKELKRLHKIIKQGEAKGFSFPINALPKEPKTITQASVNRLQKITSDSLYKKATKLDESSNIQPIKTPSSKNGKTPISEIKTPSLSLNTGKAPKQEPTELEIEYQKQRNRIRGLVRRMEKRGFQAYKPKEAFGRIPRKITEKDVERISNITADEIYENSFWINPKSGAIFPGKMGRYVLRREAGLKAAKTRKHNEAIREAEEQFIDALENDPYGIADILEERAALKEENIKASTRKTKTPKTKEELPNATKVVIENLLDSIEPFSTLTLDSIREEINNWKPLSSWSEPFVEIKRRDKDTLSRIIEGAINNYGLEGVARNLEANAVEIIPLIHEILYGSGSKEHDFGTGRNQVNEDLVRVASVIKGGALTMQEARDLHDMTEEMEVNN